MGLGGPASLGDGFLQRSVQGAVTGRASLHCKACWYTGAPLLEASLGGGVHLTWERGLNTGKPKKMAEVHTDQGAGKTQWFLRAQH